MWRRPHSKFEEDSFSYFQDTSNQTFEKILSFCTLCKNHYNSHMRASISLKFGTLIGYLKVNTSIKFGVNLINIQRVISNFTHKAKLNFYHTYRINNFKEQTENQ